MSDLGEASAPSPPPAPPPPLPPVFSPRSLLSHGKSSEENGEAGGELETKEIEEEDFVTHLSTLVEQILSLDREEEEVTLVVTVPLRRVMLQNGPMCGLVALAEAFELMENQNRAPVSPSKLLETAREKGLTKQGEMFSIAGMKSLAQMFGTCQCSEILNLEDISPMEGFRRVASRILMGFPVLFPYDADYNHSPALRKGHAAHWTVVHGIACNIPQEKVKMLLNHPMYYQQLRSTSKFLILKPVMNFHELQPSCLKLAGKEAVEILDRLVNLLNLDRSYVIAHQGKSYHTALWKLSDLFRSNQNLKEIAPKIIDNRDSYIFDNIVNGLCSKVLLLQPKCLDSHT